MGLVDAFSAEITVNMKFSDFYNLVKGCTQRDMLLNGVKCDVPHKFLREMMSGEKEPEPLISCIPGEHYYEGIFEDDVSMYVQADKDHIFILTDAGYEHTPTDYMSTRKVGEPVRGFEYKVPKSWTEKGYVALSDKKEYIEAHSVNPFTQEV